MAKQKLDGTNLNLGKVLKNNIGWFHHFKWLARYLIVVQITLQTIMKIPYVILTKQLKNEFPQDGEKNKINKATLVCFPLHSTRRYFWWGKISL